MNQSEQTDRFLPPDAADDDSGTGPDSEYEWAEYNLPVFPIARTFFREDASEETDFIGLTIDMDPQPFGNS